jgi:hypothetical protein
MTAAVVVLVLIGVGVAVGWLMFRDDNEWTGAVSIRCTLESSDDDVCGSLRGLLVDDVCARGSDEVRVTTVYVNRFDGRESFRKTIRRSC